eukprot:TRINITY_DN76447_c0_g1_i1.p1 TRINITY_DN76447_c0_g1~~TRINITY_DN76447_c0_g1_i1.p1  ORF type:complete len:254 (+),score=37.26 TRINITY_DN76447_c0_g1_i1:65-763(+)
MGDLGSLTIQTLAGETIPVEGMTLETPVKKLKEKVAELHGDSWPVELQLLIFNGVVLKPDTEQLGTFLSGAPASTLLLVKVFPGKVYFAGIGSYDIANIVKVGLSDRGISEGGQPTNDVSHDLFKKVPKGQGFSFESTNNPGLFLLVPDSTSAWEGQVVLGPPDGESEIFRIVPALNEKPEPACSMESTKRPEHYICHCNGKIWCHNPETAMQRNRRVFNDDSTWTLIEGEN